jgi:hypothetical protein
MGGCGGTPNFNGYVGLAFGTWGDGSLFPVLAPIGFVFGTNPPYYLDDFLSVYPKFFGPPTLTSNAGTTANSNVVTVPSTVGFAPGQFVQIPGCPPSTLITGIASGQIKVSNPCTVTASNISFTSYQAPPIPLGVIQLYLNLANASLVKPGRWEEQWYVGMAFFIAHYCTLYARSDAAEVTSIVQSYIHSETPAGTIPGSTFVLSAQPPSGVLQGLFINGLFQRPGIDYMLNGVTISLTNPAPSGATIQATWPLQTSVPTQGVPSTAQLAAQGLMNGILSSKSVGDVSASYTVLSEQEGWGTFRTTTYGAQLIDMAKVVGSGPGLFI